MSVCWTTSQVATLCRMLGAIESQTIEVANFVFTERGVELREVTSNRSNIVVMDMPRDELAKDGTYEFTAPPPTAGEEDRVIMGFALGPMRSILSVLSTRQIGATITLKYTINSDVYTVLAHNESGRAWKYETPVCNVPVTNAVLIPEDADSIAVMLMTKELTTASASLQPVNRNFMAITIGSRGVNFFTRNRDVETRVAHYNVPHGDAGAGETIDATRFSMTYPSESLTRFARSMLSERTKMALCRISSDTLLLLLTQDIEALGSITLMSAPATGEHRIEVPVAATPHKRRAPPPPPRSTPAPAPTPDDPMAGLRARLRRLQNTLTIE